MAISWKVAASILSLAAPNTAAVWLGFWKSKHVFLKSMICTSALHWWQWPNHQDQWSMWSWKYDSVQDAGQGLTLPCPSVQWRQVDSEGIFCHPGSISDKFGWQNFLFQWLFLWWGVKWHDRIKCERHMERQNFVRKYYSRWNHVIMLLLVYAYIK